jgi:hypothetical protein
VVRFYCTPSDLSYGHVHDTYHIFFPFGPVHGLILQHGSVIALVALVNSEDYFEIIFYVLTNI